MGVIFWILREFFGIGSCGNFLESEPTPAYTGYWNFLALLVLIRTGTLWIHLYQFSEIWFRKLHQYKLEYRILREFCGTDTYISIHWLLEPSSTSCTNTGRNPPEPPTLIFRNLTPETTLAQIGTLRNLLEAASGTYTSTHWEPSGIGSRNLKHHIPEPSGTFGNLPPEPAPATRTGTHRRLSGLKTPLIYVIGE